MASSICPPPPPPRRSPSRHRMREGGSFMYPIAHAWLIQRLIPDATSAHFLGCVWPDMLYDSPLTHPLSHRSGRLLVERARNVADASATEIVRTFVAGALSHGSEPRGFDWYSDEEYGGQPAAA